MSILSGQNFFGFHKRTIVTIAFLVVYSVGVSFANPPTTPYQPGATIDPLCAPGTANCTVQIIPEQSGGANKYLTTDGTSTAWSAYTLILGGNFTTSGNYATTLTTTGTTALTLPTTGTLATLAGAETFSNKTFATAPVFSTLTQGAIPFLGSGSVLTQDTANLYWDDINNRLGIGTSTPQATLSVAGDIGVTADDEYDLGSPTNRFANVYTTNIVATTITGTITPSGFTSGSVIFSGTSGTLNEDTAAFFYDNTNNRLGIGTNTPQSALSVGAGSAFQVSSGGAITSATGIISSGAVTFSGLNSVGVVHTDANGLLSTAPVALTSDVSGVLPVANGGTGASTLTGFIIGSGTNPMTAVTLSSGVATVLSDETGSGALVFGTSPTLLTPTIATIINSGTLTLPTSTDTLVGRATTDTLTNKTLSGSTNTFSDIPNSALVNSTISGVALGGNLNDLTIGTGLQLNSGTAYNGSTARTISIDSTVATLTGTQTLTNKTITAGSNTITGLTNANLSGTAGITNANLANSSITINGNTVSLGGSTTVTANTTNAVTFNNGGAGEASGTTFNGSTARTISYNTVGAPSTTGANASGTWGINITGSAGTATYAQNSTRLYSSDTSYAYGSANPYYGYLTYDGSRWLFQVNPASPAAVRVAYADLAGSISGQANSATINASQTYAANNIVRYDASGYIQAYYINSATSNSEITPSQFVTTNGSDNYYRKASVAQVQSALGLGSNAYTSTSFWSTSSMDASRGIGASTNLDTDLDNGGAYGSYGSGGTSWNAPFSYGGVLGFSFVSGIKAQLGFDIRHGSTDYGNLVLRTKNSSGWSTWRTVLHSGNYNSYAPTLTGGGASGTWGINITGNASTLTQGGYYVNPSGNSYVNALQGGGGSLLANWPGYPAGIQQTNGNYIYPGFLSGQGTGWNTSYYLAGSTSWGLYSNTSLNAQGLYDSGNRVCSPAIGTCSVSISGNANTVDGYEAVSFPYRSGVTSGYYQVADWMQFNTSAGLYWPGYYGAHIEPNTTGSYGQIMMRGAKNGWSGLYFYDTGATLMMNANETGHYMQGYGWQFRWTSGNMYVSKNTYGGGSEALVLDSLNQPYAYNLNQNLRTSDSPSFAYLSLNNSESLGLYGIRGRFSNEYIHMYNKVGIGNPTGWGTGETSTPTYGLSTYGGAVIGYGNSGGLTTYGTTYGSGGFRYNDSVAVDSGFGLYFSSDASTAYGIFRESGSWGGSYPDLRIAFHTGISLGANASYGGIRFFNDYTMATELMSVGNGDGNVRVVNGMIAYSYQGNGNVAGTGSASYHPSGIYSTGTNWLYGTMYVNGNNINDINIAYATGSFRAPIFYDSNDTGYYGDFAGTSSFNTLSANYIVSGGATINEILYVSRAAGGVSVADFTDTSYGVVCQIVPASFTMSCYSDEALKKNITTLDGNPFSATTLDIANKTILEKVLMITPVQFNWRQQSDTDQKATGFIAQNVEQIFPELVTTNSQTGYRSLNYTGLIPYTISALQELTIRVQALEVPEATLGAHIEDFFNTVLLSVSDGVASIKGLATEILTIGSPEKRTGVTLYDEVTGEPYCLSIANGSPKTTAGECGIITPESLSASVTNPEDGSPEEQPEPEPTPEEQQPQPEETPEPDPAPQQDPDPAPIEPELTPEPSL